MIAEEQSKNLSKETLNRYDALLLLLLGAFGAVLLLSAVIQSTDYAYGTSDDYNHYLFAVSSPENLKFLFNGWGKPIFTLALLIYLQAAGQSLQNARFLNCGFFLLSALLTYALARRLTLRPEAAFLSGMLMLLARQNLELAQSILTEPLFTVFVLLTFLSYSDAKYRVAFLLAGLSLLARSEGLFLIVVLLVAHYWRFGSRKTINHGGVAVLPPILTALTTSILFGEPFLAFFPPNYSTYQIYGHGQPLEYVLGTQEALGLPTMLLALLGIIVWASRIKQSNLIIAPFLAFGIIVVVFHDVIWALGLFGSWGTLRHLAPTTSVFAYFAGYAFQQCWDYLDAQGWKFRLKTPLRVISLGAVILIVGVWTIWHTDLVVTPSVEVQVSKEAVAWLKANRPDALENSQKLFICHSPIILALLDLTYPDVPNREGALIDRETLEKELQPGGIVLWDSHHGPLEGETSQDYFDTGFETLFMANETWYVDSHGNRVDFTVFVFLKLV